MKHKSMQLLGYNYQSSKWYEKSYSVFNRMYEWVKEERKKSLLYKAKSLLDLDGLKNQKEYKENKIIKKL